MPKWGRGSGEKEFGGECKCSNTGKGGGRRGVDKDKFRRYKSPQFYSHSVVPGGLDVRSYITLEMPGIFLISLTILRTTCGQGSMS